MPPNAVDRLRSSSDTTLQDFGLLVAEALEIESGSSFQVGGDQLLPLNLGRSIRLQQVLNDIPIWGADVIAHQDAAGDIINLRGRAVYDLPPAVRNASDRSPMSTDRALARAMEFVAQDMRADDAVDPIYRDSEATLMYYLGPDGRLVLSYYTTLYAVLPDSPRGFQHTKPVYIIDATTGERLESYDNLQRAYLGVGPGGNAQTGRYTWGANNLPKLDVTTTGPDCHLSSKGITTTNMGNGIAIAVARPWHFPCYRNTFKTTNGAFSPLNDAHGFAQVTVEMFKDWYAIPPKSDGLRIKVHYGTDNAHASWDGRFLLFGDGDATTYYPPIAVDSVAHEVAHAFTDTNAKLYYFGESGGINEAFSDMVGEATEYYVYAKYGPVLPRSMPDLRVGADIMKRPGAAMREMCDPPQDLASIAHVDDYYDGMSVHHSSGVYNKVFCLLVDEFGWGVREALDLFVLANALKWCSWDTFHSAAAAVLEVAIERGYRDRDVVGAFGEVGIDLREDFGAMGRKRVCAR